MRHRELLINGFFFGGPCDSSVGKEVVRDCYSRNVWGTVAEGGWSELNTAIESAAQAFESWKSSPFPERQILLRKIAENVRARRDELAEILVAEIGKPIVWAEGEVDRLAITFDTAAKALSDWGWQPVDVSLDPRHESYEVSSCRSPRGVVLAIVPYNWPYNLAAHKIAPAIASGNTVVMKVSPLAPYAGLTLARLIHESGCPEGVVNAWNGPDALMKKAVAHPRVDVISFTGSAKVGWSIPQDKHLILELGCDAHVIFNRGTKLSHAVPAVIKSAFGYAGQVCIAAQHLWVHESLFEEAKDRLIVETNECPTGDPARRETVCGPLIHAQAAARVAEWIAEGGEILAGGGRTGNVIQPTLILNPRGLLATEEVFGPVLTLRSFTDIREPIEAVNSSKYGIHASIFGDDALALSCQLNVGGVVVDDVPSTRFDAAPYGGLKQSGLGREGVHAAMQEFTTDQTRIVRRAT